MRLAFISFVMLAAVTGLSTAPAFAGSDRAELMEKAMEAKIKMAEKMAEAKEEAMEKKMKMAKKMAKAKQKAAKQRMKAMKDMMD